MQPLATLAHPVDRPDALCAAWQAVRQLSVELAAPLSEADCCVQSMDDASPIKWHLAHTTWFLEEFILRREMPQRPAFHAAFGFLFNSYYDAVGERQPRAKRGLLTRPALAEILAYRAHVDGAVAELFALGVLDPHALALLTLGMHHEQQHQELMLTDVLHLFAQNPLRPAYVSPIHLASPISAAEPSRWVDYPGGIVPIGHAGAGFAFDCETPRHDVLLRPYALASRPVSNRDWLQFMAAKGYDEARFWLADGWKVAREQAWQAPLYWEQRDGTWWQMTLLGMMPLELDAPVAHVSYFEADAFARFAGARLPTEFEWETAAALQPLTGQFLDLRRLRPLPASEPQPGPLQQLYGDVWEWTSSPFMAYPGFRVAQGAVGEYNGKFMNGQLVLRGGSCATPAGHLRPSYRNFFYPHQRWQFSGLRLAKDLF